ncbi:hypothetical protein V8C35DRAFT_315112 [Trichoderma chlorosporum]
MTRCWAVPLTTGVPESSRLQSPSYTSTCNTTSTANGTVGNGTFTYSRSNSYPYPLPTTFETSTTAKDHGSGSRGFAYPVPTEPVHEEELPPNPSYPWGASSPLHRHQNVTSFSDGLFARGNKVMDWSKTAASRLIDLFKKHAERDEGEDED